ncbi:MAG: hypothetical protein HYT79_07865 [Elusimicrobia bacterium]|nr:hypothetical protein [Elusimicrobiota bacterium]
MKLQAKTEAPISWDTIREVFEHLEGIGYFGKVEIAFQGKPVRVNFNRSMKGDEELKRFLLRERPAVYNAKPVANGND